MGVVDRDDCSNPKDVLFPLAKRLALSNPANARTILLSCVPYRTSNDNSRSLRFQVYLRALLSRAFVF